MISVVGDDAATEARTARTAVILIGAPGAGKGTQAVRLASALGLAHVSTGELFREAIREASTIGKSVAGHIKRGALVPDALTLDIVRGRLAYPDAAPGFILDGFPRTRAQAEGLDAMLEGEGEGDIPLLALYIEVSTDVLVERLSGRRVCAKDDKHVYHLVGRPPERPGVCDVDGGALVQRADDEPETVRARLERQMPPMFEVIDHYAEASALVLIDGERDIDAVTEDMLAAVARSRSSA